MTEYLSNGKNREHYNANRRKYYRKNREKILENQRNWKKRREAQEEAG